MSPGKDRAALTSEQTALLERVACGELAPDDRALSAHAAASSAFAAALDELRVTLAGLAEARRAYRAAVAEPEQDEDRRLARDALRGVVDPRPTELRPVPVATRSNRRLIALAVAALVVSALVWWRAGNGTDVPPREILGGPLEILVPAEPLLPGSVLRWVGPELAGGQGFRVEAAASVDASDLLWQSSVLRARECPLAAELFARDAAELALRVVLLDEFRKVLRSSAWVSLPIGR